MTAFAALYNFLPNYCFLVSNISASLLFYKMPEGNGSTAYGEATVNGLLQKESKLSAPSQTSKEDMQLVLQSFRLLIADLCEQFGMGKSRSASITPYTDRFIGHPGSAIGMAALGVALWKYIMRYAPHQPDWFNRDRFLLSNGISSISRIIEGALAKYPCRSCMSLPIRKPLPIWLRGYDLGAIVIVPLRAA